MAQYFCHRCAVISGYLNTGCNAHIDFTGSTYQLDKFIKHTVLPSSGSGLVSIFNDPSYESYSGYIVNTMASGSVEIDDQGRKNVIFYGSQSQGMRFVDGIPQEHNDTVKVVLPDNPAKVHVFPVSSSSIITEDCNSCGTNVLTGSTSS